MTETLFNQIYTEFYERIFRYCYYKLGNIKDTEDCVQDTFYALYVSNTINDYTNIQWWLYTVADRYIYKIWNARKKTVPDEQAETQYSKKFFEDGFDNLRLNLLLADIEKHLSAQDKELFLLLYRKEKSISEISQLLSVSSSAVYKRKSRLDKKLRVILANLDSNKN